MAQVFGFLREDQATHGEKIVLRLLKDNLPKEFAVYVECPLPVRRGHRYPDFIIVTNYGVVILEIKDWIQVEQLDRYEARIRTRQNQTRVEKNPVNAAREQALVLAEVLRDVHHKRQSTYQEIPWGYAVVLPNLPTSVITQLRSVWGEEFVLNTDFLDSPLILNSLKATLPKEKIRDLKKVELDFIRATINPTVFIETPAHLPIILDNEQEQIISEPLRQEIQKGDTTGETATQTVLFSEPTIVDADVIAHPTDTEDAISHNASIRLVRGVAGSGKTLVLAQRAKYLSASFPEWKIAVVTYNKALSQHFQSLFRGFPLIKPFTFHGQCTMILKQISLWKDPADRRKWIEEHKKDYPVFEELDLPFLDDEFTWMIAMGLENRDAYLDVERRGRGQQRRLGNRQREQVFDLFEAYRMYLDETGQMDWDDIPQQTLQALQSQPEIHQSYDAILIDEAQDFAPIWIQILLHRLKPEGVVFLTDDPAQSIYRFYSWRQKGIPVVGRTRWLRIPYRNTFEIYQAAYSVIQEDEILQESMKNEGMSIHPQLDDQAMRHGNRPVLQRFADDENEASFIRSRIEGYLQNGLPADQIAVLHRRTKGLRWLENVLRGLDVQVNTFHALKGLEFEVVFLSQLNETFPRSHTKEEVSEEKRLIYMAMTRARQDLFLGYQGKLPDDLRCLRPYVDWIQH
jgi:hypothetical protein